MLATTETALHGAGLSIPSVLERKAEPFLAIAATGEMVKLPEFAPPKFAILHGYMAENGIEGRYGFFRYRRFSDGAVTLDVGTATTGAASGDGEVIAGELPAGRYASATYRGPYDRLYDAFLMLEGWLKGRGLACEGTHDGKGWEPACQLEIYRISPADTDDPMQWETDLLLKIAD
ncbi:MAG: GyrI-like domain-containing protein [Nitratireductor sp.]|nr:GyrI-like domain-containing protein [Nitratireductor sp.]